MLGAMPVLPRAIVIGASGAGLIGAMIGLLVGLAAYPPTAAFAVIELGVPATIAGALAGLLTGSIIRIIRRIGRPNL